MEEIKSRAEILSLIKSVSEENCITNYIISDAKTTQRGGGYFEDIFTLTITDEQCDNQLNIVIKTAATGEKVPLQNEIGFYMDVKPSFENLERKHGIQSLEFAPKCLKVSFEDEAQILILEQLKCFHAYNRKLSLDDDHLSLIFKNYGRIHGYSFVLREQNLEEYAHVTNGIYNVFQDFAKNEKFLAFSTQIIEMVQCDLIPGQDDEIIQKLGKYAGKVELRKMFEDVVTENVDFSAILHGDSWSNNILLKYEGMKPIDLRVVNWELMKVGSPVCDLSYCLYSGAPKDIFDNLGDYLRVYYDSFSSCVRQLGGDPKKLFPFSALKEHWQKYAKFGFIMSLPIIKTNFTENGDVIDFKDVISMEEGTGAVACQGFNKEGFGRRMRDLLHHLVQIDAL